MPIQLSRYSAQLDAPSKSGSVGVSNPEALTAGINTGMGKILQQAGQEGMAISNLYEQKKEAARKEVESVNLKTAMMEDEMTWIDQAENSADYINLEKNVSDFNKTNLEKYNSMITNEKERQQYEPVIRKNQLSLAIRTKAIADKKQISQWGVDFITKTLPTYQKAYTNTGNPELIDEIKGVAESLVKTGAINPAVFININKNFAREGDFERAVAEIEMRGVQGWSTMPIKERLSKFSNLEPEDWMKLSGVIKSKMQDQSFMENEYQKVKSVDALNILANGKMSVGQKVAGIQKLAQPDPVTGMTGIDPLRAWTIIHGLQNEAKQDGDKGDKAAYIYAMGAAQEGKLTPQDKLKYKSMLTDEQFARVDVTNNMAISKEKDADHKTLVSEVKRESMEYARELNGMFPKDKPLRDMLLADYTNTASDYLNVSDKDTLEKLNNRRMNMLGWAKKTGVKSAIKQLEKITATGIYPETKEPKSKGASSTKSKFTVIEVKK
jgi:hypothetical protein